MKISAQKNKDDKMKVTIFLKSGQTIAVKVDEITTAPGLNGKISKMSWRATKGAETLQYIDVEDISAITVWAGEKDAK